MTIRVIVNGAKGHMGQEAVAAIEADPNLTLVACGHKGDDIKDLITSNPTDVMVDLTHPEVVYHHTDTILRAGIHPVIGTSGLTDEEITNLKALADERQVGGIIVPNFSLGAVWMMQLAAHAVNTFPDVEILEAHGPHKADAPSATALRTASLLDKKRAHKPVPDHDSPARGARHHGIPIHAIRLPGAVAHQQVWFGAPGETLTIAHHCTDRKAFMPGLILACQKAPFLKTLLYGLEHLL